MKAPSVAALVFATLCAGCPRERVLKYVDDVDVSAVRADLGCADGGGAEGCRILDDFDQAGAFEAYPLSSNDVWFGRAACTGDPRDATRFAYAQVRQISAAFDGPPDVKVDPTRELAYSAAIVVGAAQEGEHDIATLQGRAREPLPATSFLYLVRAKGRSALGAPLVTRRSSDPAARYYFRRAGDRVLVVQPSRPPLASPLSVQFACVAELRRVVPNSTPSDQ